MSSSLSLSLSISLPWLSPLASPSSQLAGDMGDSRVDLNPLFVPSSSSEEEENVKNGGKMRRRAKIAEGVDLWVSYLSAHDTWPSPARSVTIHDIHTSMSLSVCLCDCVCVRVCV